MDYAELCEDSEYEKIVVKNIEINNKINKILNIDVEFLT
jgi:hypothetical protein